MIDLDKWIVRIMLAIVALTAVLLITSNSHADDYASAMLGVFNSGKSGLSETKFVNVGHRESTNFGLSYQYEGGGWFDTAHNGRKTSGYIAGQAGVEAGDTVVARVMTGPAIISSPDSYLGGYFQFTEDFAIGIKGSNGNTVYIMYKHFSSAGLEQPNTGRDFAGVSVSIPW